MKKFSMSATIAACVSALSILLIGCGGGGTPVPDLDQALDIAAQSLNQFEDSGRSDINEENAMNEFALVYTNNLNAAQPAMHTGQLGVEAQVDGAFGVFDDKNSNKEIDSDEKELFKVEVDEVNGRLVASAESYVRESGFSGSGLLMGYLIGSMLGRQRTAGSNPAAKKASPKMSAKQRAGSGSHSRGK